MLQPASLSVWELVRGQHGVVARWQLLTLGFSPKAIKHRIATGRLHPIWRGVYAVGRPEVTREGMWMAALLACGPVAVLSHQSAAALWGIGIERSAAIELSVPAGVVRRRPGILVHRRGPLAQHVTKHHQIPVTSPVLTLVDLATRLGRDSLEAAINEADKRDLTDPEALRSALDELPGHPGVAVLRRTLDRRTFRATDSWLERRFLPIARRAGLPVPETQRYANQARVDFYWPELGLIVEADSLRYHRTPAQQSNDRRRDQRHAVAGLVSLRFTHEQIRYEPAEVQATLEAVAARLRALHSR